MVLSNKSDLSLTNSLDIASNFHESFRRPEEHVQLHNEFAIYVLSCGAHYKLNDLGLSTPKLVPTEVNSVTAFGSYYKTIPLYTPFFKRYSNNIPREDSQGVTAAKFHLGLIVFCPQSQDFFDSRGYY